MEEKKTEFEERLDVLMDEIKEYIKSTGSGEYGLVLAVSFPKDEENRTQIGYSFGSTFSVVAAITGLWENEKTRSLLEVAREVVDESNKEES